MDEKLVIKTIRFASVTTLIDDSGKKFSDTVGKAGRVFDVVSGSLNLGSQNDSNYSQNNMSGSGTIHEDKDLVNSILI